ncbi:TPA: hypothetical protein DDZ86_04255 [Candidatus Dependentiae bacterium]|nr:hypothetical protein [Candidatus Dependentiae bacterium]
MQLQKSPLPAERMQADSATNYKDQLSKKTFWLNVEFFLAAGSAFGLLYLQLSVLGFNLLGSLVVGYCTMLFAHFLYRQYYVDNVLLEDRADAPMPVNFVNYSRTFFSFFYIGLAYYFDRSNTLVGVWALLLAVLWVREWAFSDAHKAYGQKLLGCLYGFFFVVYLVSRWLMGVVGEPYFYLAFAAAVYVALVCQYIFELVVVYETELTEERAWMLTFSSVLLAALCLGLAFLLVNVGGFSVVVTGVAGVVVVKLLQPWTIRFFR